MSVPFTTNVRMLDGVSATTTSNAFPVSDRERLSIELTAPLVATTGTFTFSVSNDGTNFVAYNRITTNVTDDSTHGDTRVASVTVTSSVTSAFAFFPDDDFFRYIKVTCTVTAAGGIATSSISAAGSGYSVNDVLTVADGSGGTIKVLTVDGSGVVLTYSLVTAGTDYTVATHATTGGAGTGFILSVDTLTPTLFMAILQSQA